MMKRFIGKTVVVTGGSRGIGLGIAERFAEEGANLVLADKASGVEEAAEKIKTLGVGALGAVCDVTNKGEVEDLYKRAAEQFGSVDVSIQNAGVITIEKLENLTEKDWNFVMAVNTTGVFLCCQAAAKYMIKQGSGRLINSSSAQGRQGFHLHATLCCEQIRGDRPYPKSGEGIGTPRDNGERYLPWNYRNGHVGV